MVLRSVMTGKRTPIEQLNPVRAMEKAAEDARLSALPGHVPDEISEEEAARRWEEVRNNPEWN